MKRLFTPIFLIFCLIIATAPLDQAVHFEIIDYPNLDHEFETNINLVLDSELENTAILQEIVEINGTRTRSYSGLGIHTTNLITINYEVLSTTDRSNFRDYLKSIEDSSNPNGHDFNSTAFDQGETEVFTNITGRSYDAESSLNWLSENVWDQTQNEFTLFLFNFTDLDEGMNHWFKIHQEDVDSNTTRLSFFSGTNGLYHGKSVSGWGGHQNQPIHFLDFSSDLWYGDFINNAWGGSYQDSLLSLKLQNFSSGQEDARDIWLSNYVRSFIFQTYDMKLFNAAPLGETVKVENLVLFDWNEYGMTPEENRWLISVDEINRTFSNSFDWMEFNITERWEDLSQFDHLLQEMESYKTENPNGDGYHLEISSGFKNYLKNTFIPQNFDMTGADIILPSVVFLLNDTTFTFGGTPIAGIADGSFQLQGLIPDRYYHNGERNRGFSDVIIHEVGHNLGLPHPFDISNSWAGDMTASVMGYYTDAQDYSQYDVNTMGYYHSGFYLAQLEYLYSNDTGDHGLENELNQLITEANNQQNDWNFKNAIDLAEFGLCFYADLYNSTDSRCDEQISNDEVEAILSDIFSDISSSPMVSDNSETTEENWLPNGIGLILPVLILLPLIRKFAYHPFKK